MLSKKLTNILFTKSLTLAYSIGLVGCSISPRPQSEHSVLSPSQASEAWIFKEEEKEQKKIRKKEVIEFRIFKNMQEREMPKNFQGYPPPNPFRPPSYNSLIPPSYRGLGCQPIRPRF